MCGNGPASLECSLFPSQSMGYRPGRPYLNSGPGTRTLLGRSVTAHADPPVQSLRTFSSVTALAPAGTCHIAPLFAV